MGVPRDRPRRGRSNRDTGRRPPPSQGHRERSGRHASACGYYAADPRCRPDRGGSGTSQALPGDCVKAPGPGSYRNSMNRSQMTGAMSHRLASHRMRQFLTICALAVRHCRLAASGHALMPATALRESLNLPGTVWPVTSGLRVAISA